MLAFGDHVIAGGEFLHHLDIGNEAGAGKDAFEQIMTQDLIVRDLAAKDGFEGVDLVNALAAI